MLELQPPVAALSGDGALETSVNWIRRRRPSSKPRLRPRPSLAALLCDAAQLLLVHLHVGPLEDFGYSFSGPPGGDAYCRTHVDSLLRRAGEDHELFRQPPGDSRNIALSVR